MKDINYLESQQPDKPKAKRSSIVERVGNTEAVRSFRKFGWGAYKISDVQGSRFTETKPCDIIAQSPKGLYVAVEGKMIKKWAKVSAKLFRPNQIEELDGACKRNGKAFLFVYVRIQPNKEKNIERVHALLVFDWKKYRNRLMTVGIGAKELRERLHGIFIPVEKEVIERKGKEPVVRYFYDIRGIMEGKGQLISDEIW
jgi:hypothetical protein